MKHKPGGGDKKIFNDRDYLRQSGTNPESLCGSGSQVCFILQNLENNYLLFQTKCGSYNFYIQRLGSSNGLVR